MRKVTDTPKEHHYTETTYVELQQLPDGHEALWIHSTNPTTGQKHVHCFTLPVGYSFNANPELRWDPALAAQAMCVEMHCTAAAQEHNYGSDNCDWAIQPNGLPAPYWGPEVIPNPAKVTEPTQPTNT